MAYQATQKTEANKANKRQKIIEATQKRIRKAGFAGVSMANIAKEAGVATGTLYRYFPSKQALCTEVFRIYTDIEVRLIHSLATEPNQNPAQKLIAAIEVFSLRAIKSRHLAWSLIVEPLDPALEAERLHYRTSYAAIYTQLIEEGIEQHQFQPQVSSVSAAAIVGALAESLVGPLSVLAQHPDQNRNTSNMTTEHEQLIQNITRFCLSAVGYRAGCQQCEPHQFKQVQGNNDDTSYSC
jgi:AcrR family transcriptional regulator